MKQRNGFYVSLAVILMVWTAVVCLWIQADASNVIYMSGAHLGESVAAAACDTVEQEEDSDTDNYGYAIGTFPGFAWYATKITATETEPDYCGVSVYLTIVINPTEKLTVYVYTVDGDNKPSTQVTNAVSVAKPETPMVTGHQKFSMANNFSLTSGTEYYIVIYRDGVDNTNFPEWEAPLVATTEYIFYSGDGLAWDQGTDARGCRYRLYTE